MSAEVVTQEEREFMEQRHEFLALATSRYPLAPRTVDELLVKSPGPVAPVYVESLEGLTDDEAQAVADSMTTDGVAHVVPLVFSSKPSGERHQLLAFADRLRLMLPIGYPVDHPMEEHLEARARFGAPDGTLKIYNLPVEPGGPRYREQAETNEMFDSHNDGLGYAGLIQTVIFVLDSPPLAGGYTYFQNIIEAAAAIAKSDEEAFSALFLPDAITAVRPRGKGAIKVTSPVLFLGRDGSPQVFFRVATGEYRIEWRHDEPLRRARAILEQLAKPFGPNSRFVHLMQPGEAVVIDNRHVIHGRTPFTDRPGTPGRILARKWFVPSKSDAIYRHVPAVHVDRRWSRLFPDQFAEDRLVGDWHYDAESGRNVRVSA